MSFGDELDDHFQQQLVFEVLGVVYTAILDARGMQGFILGKHLDISKGFYCEVESTKVGSRQSISYLC